jgi:hypothetical protein
MTTLATLNDIEEKAGVVIRDLLKTDSTLTTLMGRSADASIHYSYVPESKTRDGKKYPYIRIDLGDSAVSDLSHDGAAIQTNLVLIVHCWDVKPFTTHKMAGRVRTVINENAATLRDSHMICRSAALGNSYEPDGSKTITHDTVRLFIYAEGDRS